MLIGGVVLAAFAVIALGPVTIPVGLLLTTWSAWMIGGLVVSEDG